jgi:hypothetical protein
VRERESTFNSLSSVVARFKVSQPRPVITHPTFCAQSSSVTCSKPFPPTHLGDDTLPGQNVLVQFDTCGMSPHILRITQDSGMVLAQFQISFNLREDIPPIPVLPDPLSDGECASLGNRSLAGI